MGGVAPGLMGGLLIGPPLITEKSRSRDFPASASKMHRDCWSSRPVAASVGPAETGPLQPTSLLPRSPENVLSDGIEAESAK